MVEIKEVNEGSEYLNNVVELFKAHQAELDENICFQSFEKELENPLYKYAAPEGALFIALVNNEVAGCIALQFLPDENQQRICEMKRMYVKPEFRKLKLGVGLVEKLIDKAKELKYEVMKLDTLEKLQPAIKLYEKFGFKITGAYYKNPLKGVVYMSKELKSKN